MALLLPFTISRPSQNKLVGPPVTDFVSWLNASDKVACNTSTAVVSNWNDESRAWNIGSWATIAPTYNPSYRNGYGAITFNATNPNTNQTVPISSAKIDFTTSNALTIMNAWIVNSTTNCRTLAGITPDGTTNNFLLWGQGMNGGTLPGTTVWIRTGNGSDYLGTGPTITFSTGMLIVYTVTYLQTSSNTSTVTFSVNNANTITGSSSQFSSNQFYLTPVSEGSYSPPNFNPNRSTNSSMLETIAWNRILSSTEQSNVYNYLLAKFTIPTLTISGTTATVTIPVSYSNISIALFQNTIASTSGGTVFATANTSGATATFTVTPGYFYYASVNGSTSYTNILGAVPGPASPLTDMTTWLNAGVGVVTTSGNVTTWYDTNNYLNINYWNSYSVTSNPTYANGYSAIITPSGSTTINYNAPIPHSSSTFNWRTTGSLTYITAVLISNVSSYLDINSISIGNNGYNGDLQITGAYSSGNTTLGLQFGTGYVSNTMPTFVAGSLAIVIGSYSYDGTTITQKISINNGTVNTTTSTNTNDVLSSNVSLYPVSSPSITNGGNYPSAAANGVALLDKMMWTRVLSAAEQSNMYNYLAAKYTTYSAYSSSTSVTVPTGYSNAYVYMWGAGGGGSTTGGGGNGGYGAFISGYMAVTSGATLTLVVGQGGVAASTATTTGGGGGGVNAGASGGGGSRIEFGGYPQVVAGGGGGGGNNDGGQGGATFSGTTFTATPVQNGSVGAGGGTSTGNGSSAPGGGLGGAHGQGANDGGDNGGYLTGGTAHAFQGACSGGGGGGLYGGAGGGIYANGGGGGSSYYSSVLTMPIYAYNSASIAQVLPPSIQTMYNSYSPVPAKSGSTSATVSLTYGGSGLIVIGFFK
jgi:hypothetical protein